MTINTLSASVAVSGAALPRVATACAIPSSARVHSALPQNFGPALPSANWRFVAPRVAAAMARPVAVKAAGLPVDIRKQYTHKTRVNVGGDGASGPHPEREPA